MSEQRLEFYRKMRRIRMVEEEIAFRYNGKIREMHTPIHLSDGQEAVAVGVCANLNNDDFIFSNHRCHAHYLAKGGDLRKMIAELYNRETGCCGGYGASMHLYDPEHGVALSSSIVAGNVPIGTGFGLAQKIKKSNQISVVFFGDGASEEGAVYESVCFAQLFHLPVLFVCENNFMAISTPFSKREPNHDIISKFSQILPAVKLDGNDVEDVYENAKLQIQSIRNSGGPAFMQCDTYRFRAHHNVGDGIDGKYRTKEEYEHQKGKDPLIRLKNKLLIEDRLGDKVLELIENEISKEIEDAFAFAENSPCPSAEKLYGFLWR